MEKRYCYCGSEMMPTEDGDIYICPICSPNNPNQTQFPNKGHSGRGAAVRTAIKDTEKANAEAEAERAENARVYGIDPGSRDVERIENAAEWELFLEYYSVTKIAWRLNHDGSRDHSRGHISDKAWASMQKDLAELQYDIEYLLYAICKKIGIDVPDPEVDKHVSPDRETFMKWYRFYNNHFMNTLSDKEWHTFETKRKNGEDVSAYLPSGDWRK
ncbi:MAG: hypothetical protein LBC95_00505 [Candidatus Nomurabacteria bacterium]|jgi:hypothetical protein|nr:hypothetical protein [Candidatus Nomurabacteria bacterium]